ncbi:hypothetical protein K6V78_10270 [Streptococcus gallolyticus]|uniref:cell wall-active antibiotics response protein LiaF n=1 Tax=Streptococcus hepaticus TaxID=3349163 RepID=UPI001C97885B|nr:hypothetical protein [Streptococcus gallolyticus]MBY5041949.1 hypothetical protein [Streptococcus gallolyticus]
MKKVQFFLLVEAFIFTLALFDILASDTARVLLLLAALLLLVWYFTSRKVNSMLVTSANILIFLVFVLNPFFIVGVLIALLYVVVNFFARYEKRNQYTYIIMDDETLSVDRRKNKWLGNQEHAKDQYGFEDINIIRLFGNDVVDLDETVLVGRDNIVMVRKVFGRTKIVIPIDVEVSLSATSLYGQVRFLGLSEWDLRNESLAISSPHYKESHKRVKIVNNSLFGDVEVVRV